MHQKMGKRSLRFIPKTNPLWGSILLPRTHQEKTNVYETIEYSFRYYVLLHTLPTHVSCGSGQ